MKLSCGILVKSKDKKDDSNDLEEEFTILFDWVLLNKVFLERLDLSKILL